MSQKAWMQAYTKGSKALQARLEKIHANNPEFQDFVKKHGFGGNLSVKQSGIQKKSEPVQIAAKEPEKVGGDREALIKAAAEKIRNRRMAAGNRAAFGGELGGGFSMPHASFRTYRESVNEEVPYGDATYTMRRGGWIVKRNGKPASAVLPTEHDARNFIDSTKQTPGKKFMRMLRTKLKSLAAESAENRARVRSYDSAVVTSKSGKIHKLASEKKKTLINRIAAHMSNPKFTNVSKRYFNAAFQLNNEATEMTDENKTLNELRKATLASYLAKAGKNVRTDTNLAASFDNDYYHQLKIANKHHPNVINGVEKDPKRLKDAEQQMAVNANIRDKFKRGAENRIKGIARAGRLLTKEDVLNERNTESHPELWNTHELVHKSGKVLKKGDKVKTSDGTHKIVGFELPHHSGSTGRVFVHDKQAAFKMASYFPSVVDAKIRKKVGMKIVKEDAVNEVSLVKKVKRSLAGWGAFDKDSPRELVNRTKAHDTKTLKTLQTDKKKGKGSPAELQQKVINRELKKRGVAEEAINEISRSTIAKVATKRYQQAQKALKDKNYPEYVKKIQKSHRAADATTPKTGWSHEEETQAPAGEPIVEVSAQEKYRKIKEAKVKAACSCGKGK